MTHTPYDEQWPDIEFSSGAVAFGRNATTNGNAAGDYDIIASSTTAARGRGTSGSWDEDENNQELLIGTPDLEYAPRWSPTADRVAFASHRFGSFHVFVYTLPEARDAVAR